MRKWFLKHDSALQQTPSKSPYFRQTGRSEQTEADQKTGYQTGDTLDRWSKGQATYTGRQAAGRLMQAKSG